MATAIKACAGDEVHSALLDAPIQLNLMPYYYTHSSRVVAIGQDVQQVSRGHKVEAREGQSLGFQVLSESLLTKSQLTLLCIQPLIQVGLVGSLHYISCLLNIFHQFLKTARMIWQTAPLLYTHELTLCPFHRKHLLWNNQCQDTCRLHHLHVALPKYGICHQCTELTLKSESRLSNLLESLWQLSPDVLRA